MRKVFENVFLLCDRDYANYRKDGRKKERLWTALENRDHVLVDFVPPDPPPMSGTVPLSQRTLNKYL